MSDGVIVRNVEVSELKDTDVADANPDSALTAGGEASSPPAIEPLGERDLQGLRRDVAIDVGRRVVDASGWPIRVSRSWYRGSSLTLSNRGSTPSQYIQPERSRNPFSSRSKARPVSPSAAYTPATLYAQT